MSVRTERLANAIGSASASPYANGVTIFEDEDVRHPFDGDYILKIVDAGYAFRVRYFLDRSEMVMKIVAVVAQPFGMM